MGERAGAAQLQDVDSDAGDGPPQLVQGESQRAFVVAAGTPECAGMLGRHLPPGCVTHQHFARSRKPIMVDVAERVRSLKQRNTRSRNAARSV